MSCSCKNIITIDGKSLETNTNPFETCPLCALKHLSYAIIKFNENKVRCLAQIYLAYKHLCLEFYEESNLCFNLINDYFNDKLNLENLKECVNRIHNLAISLKNDEIDFTNNLSLNFEKDLLPYQLIYLKLLIINELYNFEIGYKDINTPYVIGLLQECGELTEIEYLKIKFRTLWKMIETESKLSSESVLKLAEEFFYRYKKDLNHNLMNK